MKFMVERESASFYECPCEGAKKISESDDEIIWEIEINTLEELMNFYDKYGDLIIGSPYGHKERKQDESHAKKQRPRILHIYDYWVE